MPSILEDCSKKRVEDSIAGYRSVIQFLRELIIYPFRYADISKRFGLKWSKGLLLYGPPGTGKTSMVEAVVLESDAHIIRISAFDVENVKCLPESFSQAYSYAASGKPSIIFIDDIDSIYPSNNNRNKQQTHILCQLLALMDANSKSSKSQLHVVVVASTNRIDVIDPALRRPGRFDTEIEVGVPSVDDRIEILKLHSKNLKLDHKVDLQTIAQSCNGHVGADLVTLCHAATRQAYDRLSNMYTESEAITLIMEDWENAISEVTSSITRGITTDFPKISWDEIGGLKDLKKKIRRAVEPQPPVFARLGISPVRGILLHGLPGCSKTSLALAAAHSSQSSFFSLCVADIYSKYVGDGEALLRRTFQQARLAAPSILFLDEVDGTVPKRGVHGHNICGERLLYTLLTEMDGFEVTKGVIVIAATNRPHAIDSALLRPGRFDLILYVPPPDKEGRHEILRIHTKKMRLGEDVDLRRIAEGTDLFTGADLQGLCREAGMLAIREGLKSVYARHLETVMRCLRPSLTREMIEAYENMNLCKQELSCKIEKAKPGFLYGSFYGSVTRSLALILLSFILCFILFF